MIHLETALCTTIVGSMTCFTVIKDRTIHSIYGTWKKTGCVHSSLS